MGTLPNQSHSEEPKRRRFRGQGLVEFALVLPVMLLVIFVIIELARLLHAWLAVENGARFGVRYAVTGEFDDNYCALYPGGICDEQSEEDGARIPSIKDAARAGSVAILRNESLLPGQPGFYKVTVCSNKSGIIYYPANIDNAIPADCQPSEDGGGPGDRVSVTVDFDHPLITPFLTNWWPQLHLSAKREGIVEQFRVARVVGLPATIAVPTFTPTITPTPTITNTPTNTATPTATNCKVPPQVIIDAPDEYQYYYEYLPAQALAYDPDNTDPNMCNGMDIKANRSKDGEGITRVVFAIDYWTGSSWDRVHNQTESYAAYCGFGGSDPCPSYDLSDGYWPGGDPIQNGLHRISAQARDDEYQLSAWATLEFYIDMPPTPTPTLTPTPDCDDIYAQSIWISGDDLRVNVRNNNPMTVFLTDSSMAWSELDSNMFVNYFQYDWSTYWGGDDWSSSTSASPGNPQDWDHPAGDTMTWRSDFNNVPGGILWGDYSVHLTFDYVCHVYADLSELQPTPTRTPSPTRTPTITLTPSRTPSPTRTPTPDCDDIYSNSSQISGDDFEFRIRNNNPQPAYLKSATMNWPAGTWSPPQVFDYFRFDGNRYYDTDSTSSSVYASSSLYIGAGSNPLWESDFKSLPDGGLQGSYSATLVFEFPGWGTCNVSANAYRPTQPTATPTTPPPPPTSTATEGPPTATSPPEPTATNPPMDG
jgi:hypothetical protein